MTKTDVSCNKIIITCYQSHSSIRQILRYTRIILHEPYCFQGRKSLLEA